MSLYDAILSNVAAALHSARENASAVFVPPGNSRRYACALCPRPAYSKGMCNAHYIRDRKGKEMSAPIRARKREDTCAECGEQTGAKGGWGLCKKHYRARRSEAVKLAAISAFGGQCSRCHGFFPPAVFDFHHVGRKNDSPSELLSNGSAERIAKELAHCVLLCANCHRIEHHGF